MVNAHISRIWAFFLCSSHQLLYDGSEVMEGELINYAFILFVYWLYCICFAKEVSCGNKFVPSRIGGVRVERETFNIIFHNPFSIFIHCSEFHGFDGFPHLIITLTYTPIWISSLLLNLCYHSFTPIRLFRQT